MNRTKAPITDTLNALGLSMEATFIPWSQSRNREEPKKSINWLVTLKREGKGCLTTDYMQGIGHIPGFPVQAKMTIFLDELLSCTCETGNVYNYKTGKAASPRKLPPPNITDVLQSLLLDSDVLDYVTFEEWASDVGYNPDSREAEKIYQACLKIALQMKQMFSGQELEALQELFQDY